MEKFDNKLAYITGGSSGIGLETARQLALLGADIVLFARNRENLEQARHEIEKNKKRENQKIMCMSLDVQSDDTVRQVMKRAVEEFGIPDILINSAGVGHSDYFENITYETFDAVIKTNLYGTRNVIASLLPHMKRKGGIHRHNVVAGGPCGHVRIYGIRHLEVCAGGLFRVSSRRIEASRYKGFSRVPSRGRYAAGAP